VDINLNDAINLILALRTRQFVLEARLEEMGGLEPKGEEWDKEQLAWVEGMLEKLLKEVRS